MANEKLRRQIVFEAARLMYSRQETEYYRAKMKAGRKLCRGWVKPSDLPSNAEIRQEIQRFAFLYEGEDRTANLHEMRLVALRYMRLFANCKPKLIGSTLTGHVRKGSDVDIHVFTNSLDRVTGTLDEEGVSYDVEHKRVRKHGEERVFTHVHVRDRYDIELTVYPTDKASYPFKSSITGRTMERATIDELESLLTEEDPDFDREAAIDALEDDLDRFQIYRSLLLPLEGVRQSPKYHPEGDALTHSLQVYDLAKDELPYDEEFQLAALLHDVGKAIDPHDHVKAGLEALDDSITERTAWLIAHHMEAHQLREGTLGTRARRRLAESEDYEELMLLNTCDKAGRQRNVAVTDVDDALDEVRELARMYG